MYDAIVVGGGIAGLTSAAFLAKAGRSVLLCEKGNTCGGLVNTFERDGFLFDGGIRALENSGILFPMLKQLGLNIEFVRNRISIGIEDQVIRIDDEEDVQDYQDLLTRFYPESRQEIGEIILQIKKIMQYMDVLYGIDNPAFLDMRKDRDYLLRAVLPWMVKYALTNPKISRLQVPVVDFLKRYTSNQSLLDMISQHFFQETPAFFALSYIKLYLEYHYPLGGTGMVVEKMAASIESHGGTIRTNTEIVTVDPDKQLVADVQGETQAYRRLVWAADQKALYRSIDLNRIADPRVKKGAADRRALIADKTGNDSVFTLYLALDLDPGESYFASKNSEHFFYTPVRSGLTAIGPVPRGGERQTIEEWLEKFFLYTTYEISCPVMRDSSLAPRGKTGLIVACCLTTRSQNMLRMQAGTRSLRPCARNVSSTHWMRPSIPVSRTPFCRSFHPLR